MKNIAFLDAKWPPKGGALQHDQLILFISMLNLHRHVQLACNPHTLSRRLWMDTCVTWQWHTCFCVCAHTHGIYTYSVRSATQNAWSLNKSMEIGMHKYIHTKANNTLLLILGHTKWNWHTLKYPRSQSRRHAQTHACTHTRTQANRIQLDCLCRYPPHPHSLTQFTQKRKRIMASASQVPLPELLSQ